MSTQTNGGSDEYTDTSLSLSQAAELASALNEYDAPDMYWDDESNRSEHFRADCAEEVCRRLDRYVKKNGLDGFAVVLSEEEYRVCVEALTQLDEENGDLIKHLRYFNGDSHGY